MRAKKQQVPPPTKPSKNQNNKLKSQETTTSSHSEGMGTLRPIAFWAKSDQCSQAVEVETTHAASMSCGEENPW